MRLLNDIDNSLLNSVQFRQPAIAQCFNFVLVIQCRLDEEFEITVSYKRIIRVFSFFLILAIKSLNSCFY